MTIQEEREKKGREFFEKTKIHKEKYSINRNGIDLTIFPNVFSPAYFTDSYRFAENIAKIVWKHSFLEIGTWTGVVALCAALNDADVTFTDINHDAIKNAEHNFEKYKIHAKAYCGDVFDPIPKWMQFDFIFWNHPFNRGTNPEEDMLLKAWFDFEYNWLEKYISQAHKYLKPWWKLLLGSGSFASLSEIKTLASKYNYKMILITKTKTPLKANDIFDCDYVIYELVKNI